jgi:beta-lactamase regulating signal transducer with metallopeptidase domain
MVIDAGDSQTPPDVGSPAWIAERVYECEWAETLLRTALAASVPNLLCNATQSFGEEKGNRLSLGSPRTKTTNPKQEKKMR